MLTALCDRIIARFPRTAAPLLWLRKHRKTRRTLVIAFCHLLGTLTSVQGPVVQCVQISWIEDWNWAAGSRPTLNWTPAPAPAGS